MQIYFTITPLFFCTDSATKLKDLKPSDLLMIHLKKIFLFILLRPRSVFPSSRENYSELLNRNQKWCKKRTFQDPLLVLFVILSNHMTNPRKRLVSCFTALHFLFCHDHMVQERKNFGPRDTTCPSIIGKKSYVH